MSEQEANDNQGVLDEDWRDSAAEDFLYSLLVEGMIPGKDDIRPKQVFEQYCKVCPEFEPFQDYTNFANRLRALREKAVKRSDDRATDDAANFTHDRQIFPAPTEDTNGNAMWQKSKAQELLQQDMAEGKHKVLKPKALYETREEYYENYSLDFFRRRIYQETRAKKHRKHVQDKTDAKLAKEGEEREKKKNKAAKEAEAKLTKEAEAEAKRAAKDAKDAAAKEKKAAKDAAAKEKKAAKDAAAKKKKADGNKKK
jgi:hypothetical protein